MFIETKGLRIFVYQALFDMRCGLERLSHSACADLASPIDCLGAKGARKMERRKRRTFTSEFKAQAVELSEQIGSIAKAAQQLGIREDSIRLWKRSLGRSSSPTFSQSAQEAMRVLEENKALKKTM